MTRIRTIKAAPGTDLWGGPMTPTERLQAAIDRLTELRDRTQTTDADWVIQHGDAHDWLPALQIAVVESAWDACIPPAAADLVVILHRTIDKQLTILRSALGDADGSHDEPWAFKLAVSLADSILGAIA